MTVLAASNLTSILLSVVVGLTAAALATVGLAALRARQRKRLQSLATAEVAFDSMEQAAREAAGKEPDLLRDVLRSAVDDVAADQDLGEGLVTGALFAPATDGSFEILEGQTINLEGPGAKLHVQPGETGVGEAIHERKPVVTVFRSPLEESTIQDSEQRKLIDPALRWVIALPILADGGRPVWVMSIAGLVEPRTAEQLQSAVSHLLYYREFLELILKRIAGKRK